MERSREAKGPVPPLEVVAERAKCRQRANGALNCAAKYYYIVIAKYHYRSARPTAVAERAKFIGVLVNALASGPASYTCSAVAPVI